jgi:hypothetical protein
MAKNLRLKILEIVEQVQQSCAPVIVSIGSSDDNSIVDNESVVIKSCPPAVTDRLLKEGYKLSMTENGMEVETWALPKVTDEDEALKEHIMVIEGKFQTVGLIPNHAYDTKLALEKGDYAPKPKVAGANKEAM